MSSGAAPTAGPTPTRPSALSWVTGCTDVLDKIDKPLLLAGPEEETFWPGQAEQFDAATEPRRPWRSTDTTESIDSNDLAAWHHDFFVAAAGAAAALSGLIFVAVSINLRELLAMEKRSVALTSPGGCLNPLVSVLVVLAALRPAPSKMAEMVRRR